MYKLKKKRAGKSSRIFGAEVLDIEFSELEHLSDERETPSQIFYVCFSGSGDYLLSSLMKQGFSHVFVMEKIPLGFVVHDPNKAALDTYILPENTTEDFIGIFLKGRPDYTILRVSKKASRINTAPFGLGVHSCVSLVAYIMGVRLPWHCVTPFGLYKYLRSGKNETVKSRRMRCTVEEKPEERKKHYKGQPRKRGSFEHRFKEKMKRKD